MAASLPANVLAQLQTWANSFTQQFGQNGETGVDIGLPYHTPVYAVTPGIVSGTTSQYGGGGVVSVDSNLHYGGINGPASVYYQHLSDVVATPGQAVQVGTLLGYSGGQLGYGDNPSSPQYSTGPHIEVGINAPYGAPWNPIGPNVNPAPFIQDLAAGDTNVLGTGSGPSGSSSPPLGLPPWLWGLVVGGATASGQAQPVEAAAAIPGAVQSLVDRGVAIPLGMLLLAIGLLMLLWPQVKAGAGTAAKVAPAALM